VLRRVAAAALALVAVALAVKPEPGSAAASVAVLVARHDLAPGRLLDLSDVELRRLPVDLVPTGALREPSAADGRLLSGAARRGEPLTDVRLAGPELTKLATGRDGRAAVPIRLADAGVADLLHPGREVDVITPDTRSDSTSILAERAPVLAVRPPQDRSDQGRLIIVGLPQQQAARVASASLTQSVTVTLR
jgi:Flp pilus assembly protein CpaB